MQRINGVKVFSVTKYRERQTLGAEVSDWLQRHPDITPMDRCVIQSSDHAFHCLSIVIWYHEPQG